MCSIGEDDFGDEGGAHAMQSTEELKTVATDTTNGICKKCNAENVILYKLFFRDYECRSCFLANANHKFRATLGSSKVLPRDARVLLVFDGSAESIVLLDMLYNAQTQNNFKRLHCNVRVLFIDETVFNENADKELQIQFITTVQNHLKTYPKFPNFITSIAFHTTTTPSMEFEDIEHYWELKKQAELDFRKRIDDIQSFTSRQDFIKYHRSNLIANAAQQLNCAYVFQSDISSSLATQLLSAIALGRGYSASYDVALIDNRLANNIKLIRPLRDLTPHEIEIYLKAQSLIPIKLKSENYGAKHASLQNLTDAFVVNLQDNYSSTVSTVFRTCDKIAPKRDLHKRISELTLEDKNVDMMGDHEAICAFCGSPFETSICNTLLAIEFSRLVSKKGASTNTTMDLNGIANENLKRQNDLKQLCHACRNIENDSKIDDVLNCAI